MSSCMPSEAGGFLDDLAPLMDMIDALDRTKLKLQRIQLTVLPCGTSLQ